MIEPAAYGVVVSFGPHTKNFRDVVRAMLAIPCAVVVRSQRELMQFVQRAIENRQFAESYGQAARQLVARQMGATTRTVELLVPLIQRFEAVPSEMYRRVDLGYDTPLGEATGAQPHDRTDV